MPRFYVRKCATSGEGPHANEALAQISSRTEAIRLAFSLFCFFRLRRLCGLLQDHADDDFTVAIHFVEHARTHALAVEESADGGFQLNDEEVHGLDL
jgi:hypothetical protein